MSGRTFCRSSKNTPNAARVVGDAKPMAANAGAGDQLWPHDVLGVTDAADHAVSHVDEVPVMLAPDCGDRRVAAVEGLGHERAPVEGIPL